MRRFSGWMCVFFFQAEDGIRDFCLSRGLGDVYKRQDLKHTAKNPDVFNISFPIPFCVPAQFRPL